MTESGQGRVESLLKMISPLLAIAAFVWGIYTYRDTSLRQLRREENEAQRIADTRRIEATRPYLDRQLTLYTEATKTAATIATSDDEEATAKATKRFWQLYWGELTLIEHRDVESAMVVFKRALEAGAGRDELAPLALKLAEACRDELAASWGTDAWKR